MENSPQVAAAPFFEEKDGVKVIIRPMTKEEARIVFPYRPWQGGSESRWAGANHLLDETALLLTGIALRCKMCRATTKKDLLRDGVCPDCNGRSQNLANLDPFSSREEYYRNPASRVR